MERYWHLSCDGLDFGKEGFPTREKAIEAGKRLYREVAYGLAHYNALYDREGYLGRNPWRHDNYFYIGVKTITEKGFEIIDPIERIDPEERLSA